MEAKSRVWLPEQSAPWYTGNPGVWVCLWCVLLLVLSQPARENSGKTEVGRAGAEAGVCWGRSSGCCDLSQAGRKQVPWRGTAPQGAHVTSGCAPLLAVMICGWPTPRLQSAPLSLNVLGGCVVPRGRGSEAVRGRLNMRETMTQQQVLQPPHPSRASWKATG